MRLARKGHCYNFPTGTGLQSAARRPTELLMRLLIVEDNLELVANLFDYFEPRGFTLDAAPDGRTGLQLALTHAYDAVILDWMLPRLDGPGVLTSLRAERTTPVIMLPAKDQLADKVAGFRAGADDYLTKPFDLPELEMRLLALHARALGRPLPQLCVGDLTLDMATLQARRGGVPLKLYPASRKLLEVLMRASPRVVTRLELEHALWGDDPPDSDQLRSHLYELRRAVDAGQGVKLLHTLPKVGYRLGSA